MTFGEKVLILAKSRGSEVRGYGIQKVNNNDISSQVFNNFFSASRCKSDMHFFELQVETKKKLKT